ncbi:hypothetical protein [Mesorhizobium sp. A623]
MTTLVELADLATGHDEIIDAVALLDFADNLAGMNFDCVHAGAKSDITVDRACAANGHRQRIVAIQVGNIAYVYSAIADESVV